MDESLSQTLHFLVLLDAPVVMEDAAVDMVEIMWRELRDVIVFVFCEDTNAGFYPFPID